MQLKDIAIGVLGFVIATQAAVFAGPSPTPESSMKPTAAPARSLRGHVPANDLVRYPSEEQALKNCKNGTVGWLNTGIGYVLPKGNAYYGKTRNGFFVCEPDSKALDASPSPAGSASPGGGK